MPSVASVVEFAIARVALTETFQAHATPVAILVAASYASIARVRVLTPAATATYPAVAWTIRTVHFQMSGSASLSVVAHSAALVPMSFSFSVTHLPIDSAI